MACAIEGKEKKECLMTNWETLTNLLKEGNYEEAAIFLAATCTVFSQCGSCDICIEKLKDWGNRKAQEES
jgi:hypothetical protein